ncbi:MAG: hypothetical protein QMD36_05300 [Candidatus Aenigmarchaeota archaeon]|nr:hypothetical protein [Candidatus Aenigmarchaeota archaeon]
MRNFFLLGVLCLLIIQPIVKADGMPHPSIRPQIREEHQIVSVEVRDGEILTTLDLGIRNRPETVFSVLDNSININEMNPFWLKTFLLPSDFEPKNLCINSYDLGYYWTEISPVKISINENTVYLYTPMQCTNNAQCSQACDNLGIDFHWSGTGNNYKSWTGTCPSNVYGCMTGQCCIGQCEEGTCECRQTNVVDIYGNVCPVGTTCGSDCYCHPIKNLTKTVMTEELTKARPVELVRIPYEKKHTYCQFMKNEKISEPQFVDISSYLKPGQYNTIEIRSNVAYRSFSVNKIYLASKTKEMVKIIIPFKNMPKSVEVGGTGLNIWELDQPFKKEPGYWYGYYGGRLLTTKEAPAIASIAQNVEASIKSQVTQTQITTDVVGSFEGKVSDILSTVSLSKHSFQSKSTVLRLAGASDVESVYEAYMGDYGYVIELEIPPYELKRITVKWIEDITNDERFGYYYPLGTGKTWFDNISYTAIYVKLPNKYTINYASIPGREKAEDASYYYYRWKFVESSPSEDLNIDMKKISRAERFFLSTYIPIIGLAAFIFIIIVLTRVKIPSRYSL